MRFCWRRSQTLQGSLLHFCCPLIAPGFLLKHRALARRIQLQRSRVLYPKGRFPPLSQPAWPDIDVLNLKAPPPEEACRLCTEAIIHGQTLAKYSWGLRLSLGVLGVRPARSQLPRAPRPGAGVRSPLGAACSHSLANNFPTSPKQLGGMVCGHGAAALLPGAAF